jgi:ribonuclease D
MPEFTLVEQPTELTAVLAASDCVAIDTEFMRERTFFSQLCLVQVASGEHIYCVDPLRESDLAPFWDAAMPVPWVLHSGRQDVEVIYQAAKRMPVQVFDTQIAAALLGYPPQMGYAALVKELFDISIDKSHTRADWSRRPLPDEYLHYAAEDVEYLLPAYDVLAECLDRKGRLDWAREDSASLLDPALYDVDPATAVDRLKGARNLRGKRRAAATKLAEWREREALRSNRPRQWIAKDSALLDIASRLPSNTQELARIEGLPGGLVRRSGVRIIEAVAAAVTADQRYAPPRSPDEAQKALLKSMQAEVARRSLDLGVAPETIASKRDLSAVVIGGDRASRVLTGWRRELIGEDLLRLV